MTRQEADSRQITFEQLVLRYLMENLHTRATTKEDIDLIKDLLDVCLAIIGGHGRLRQEMEANAQGKTVAFPNATPLPSAVVEVLSSAVNILGRLENKLKSDVPTGRALQPNERQEIRDVTARAVDALRSINNSAFAAPIIARLEVAKATEATNSRLVTIQELTLELLQRHRKEVSDALKAEWIQSLKTEREDTVARFKKAEERLGDLDKGYRRLEATLDAQRSEAAKKLEQQFADLRSAVGAIASKDAEVLKLIGSKVQPVELEMQEVKLGLNKIGMSTQEEVKRLEERLDALMVSVQEEARRYLKGQIAGPLDALEVRAAQVDLKVHEMQQLASELERLQGPGTVAVYAERFRKAASDARSQSGVFLCMGAFAVMAAVALAIVLHLVLNPRSPGSTGDSLHFITTKLFLFGLFATAIAVCVHGLRKSLHNAIVNEHRANSLDSILAFSRVVQPGSEEQKALLLEAAKLIYQHRSTGFDSGEKYDANVLSDALEKVSRLGGSDKG